MGGGGCVFLGKGWCAASICAARRLQHSLSLQAYCTTFFQKPEKQYRAFVVAIVGIDLVRFSFLSLSRRVTKPTLLLPSLFSELPLLCGVRRPGFKICNISSGKKRTRRGRKGPRQGDTIKV